MEEKGSSYPKSCLKSPKELFIDMITTVQTHVDARTEKNVISFSREEYCTFFKFSHCLTEAPLAQKSEIAQRLESALKNMIECQVLPRLKRARSEYILFIELVNLWENYKEASDFLNRFTHELPKGLLSGPFCELQVWYFRKLVCEDFFHDCCESFMMVLHDARVGKVNLPGSALDKFASFCHEIGGDGDMTYFEKFQQVVGHDLVQYLLGLRQSSPDRVDMILEEELDRFKGFLDQAFIEDLKAALVVPNETSSSTDGD